MINLYEWHEHIYEFFKAHNMVVLSIDINCESNDRFYIGCKSPGRGTVQIIIDIKTRAIGDINSDFTNDDMWHELEMRCSGVSINHIRDMAINSTFAEYTFHFMQVASQYKWELL